MYRLLITYTLFGIYFSFWVILDCGGRGIYLFIVLVGICLMKDISHASDAL